MTKYILAIFSPLVVALSSTGKPQIIFSDNFDGEESYHRERTLNATTKVYKTNSLPEGHLLKKWNYSWDYQYLEGDWKQAFYVVAPGEQVMTQAGRSGAFAGTAPYRITANAEVPEGANRYTISFKQYKNDNDPVLYVIGGDIDGRNGVEIGYENQLPGTDTTVNDAYLRGTIGEGIIVEDRAFRRQWAEVRIDVDLENQIISWHINGHRMLRAFAKELRPGGYFGIYMRYERDTKFDDFLITVPEDG